MIGLLASRYCGLTLEIKVLKSAAGYYLGTINEEGPVSRESVEYWPIKEMAEAALKSGNWQQKQNP